MQCTLVCALYLLMVFLVASQNHSNAHSIYSDVINRLTVLHHLCYHIIWSCYVRILSWMLVQAYSLVQHSTDDYRAEVLCCFVFLYVFLNCIRLTGVIKHCWANRVWDGMDSVINTHRINFEGKCSPLVYQELSLVAVQKILDFSL